MTLKLTGPGGTKSVIQKCSENNVGLLQSGHWRDPTRWPFYAIDNGAYGYYVRGERWDPRQFLNMVYHALEIKEKPMFVVCPDIVAGGLSSLKFSIDWLNVLPPELPYYLAVQDGMEIGDVIKVIERFSGIFVGGTMDWKLKTATQWVELGHSLGKSCHIGRIGTYDRILAMENIEADSIDSTTWVQCSKGWKHIDYAKQQTRLEIIEDDC